MAGQAIRITRVKIDGLELETKPDSVTFTLGKPIYNTIESNRPGEMFQQEKKPGVLECEVFLTPDLDTDSLFGVSKTIHIIADNGMEWKMGSARNTKEGEVNVSDGTIALGYEGTPFVNVKTA